MLSMFHLFNVNIAPGQVAMVTFMYQEVFLASQLSQQVAIIATFVVARPGFHS